MPSWEEFKRQTKKYNKARGNWVIRPNGFAYYLEDGESFTIRIATDPRDPEREYKRAQAAKVSRSLMLFEVTHEGRFGTNRESALDFFGQLWYNVWTAGCCPTRAEVPELREAPPLPRKLATLGPMGLNELHREFLGRTRLETSNLRSLFGREAPSLCEERGLQDPREYDCPFCVQHHGEYGRYFLGEEENRYFGVKERQALLACNSCSRVLDTSY
jgi:hypothetical protein